MVLRTAILRRQSSDQANSGQGTTYVVSRCASVSGTFAKWPTRVTVGLSHGIPTSAMRNRKARSGLADVDPAVAGAHPDEGGVDAACCPIPNGIPCERDADGRDAAPRPSTLSGSTLARGSAPPLLASPLLAARAHGTTFSAKSVSGRTAAFRGREDAHERAARSGHY